MHSDFEKVRKHKQMDIMKSYFFFFRLPVARAFAICFYCGHDSNGHDEINTTSDGNEQLSLPGRPEFISSVNFGPPKN